MPMVVSIPMFIGCILAGFEYFALSRAYTIYKKENWAILNCMNHFEQACRNPASLYTKPEEVLTDLRFSSEEKKIILEHWAGDLEQLLIAEEENMPENLYENEMSPTDLLEQVHQALSTLS